MSKKSLIRTEINKEIKNLEDDIKKLDTEISIIKEQLLDLENAEYKSHMGFQIKQNKLNVIENAKDSLKNEIELYTNAFTNEMILNLDYILQLHCVISPKAYAYIIINTRLDIVRFTKSGLSINDYSRDTKAIFRKFEQVTPFLTQKVPIHIPKQPYEIIQGLIYYLTFGDAERWEREDMLNKLRFNDDAISAIVDTISDLKIKPRGQQNLNDKYSISLYGDNINPS